MYLFVLKDMTESLDRDKSAFYAKTQIRTFIRASQIRSY